MGGVYLSLPLHSGKIVLIEGQCFLYFKPVGPKVQALFESRDSDTQVYYYTTCKETEGVEE